ncbi:TetR/AcrR family transcriptional regulator [Tenggerimyces flavus]|uniref:TetR/AcrR family transcriptional regulator n=1 Tax=Tenggerimyces flavus TaxID=1708749 RepID=A0ABV7YNB1_9ACTN|nr:TetR/AcrR family transcriptional regulator [Tenggerimyces flavus]MBM7785830.1 AcrR family transcriptional regulator [Tenggerimyces flavus]
MDALPGPLARMWRVTPTRRLGRPAELDVDQVVSTAVSLADASGLAGVSLPKIAEVLGVTPMSLYRHIGSKDELYGLMEDVAYGPPPSVSAASWRDSLRGWAVALRGVFRDRPWLVRLPIAGPPSGPHTVGWMDAGLSALRATRLSWASKVTVITVVSGYVRHAELMGQQLASSRGDVSLLEAERDYGRVLASLASADRYPEVAALFASDLFETGEAAGDADADFASGLDLILDGVGVLVARFE